jgi:hypothetical protein
LEDPESDRAKRASVGILARAETIGLRVPFTIATVGMLVLAGWLTSSATGEQLGARAIARLGVSPADTASFDVVRAVMSAFVTNGPAAFWSAIAATAVLVGLTEWRYGSMRAAIAFWGTHLVTLALTWVLLAPLHLAGDATASLLFLARDVGPSAGFMGCAGYLLYGLGGKAGPLALAIGVVALSGQLAVNLGTVASEPAEVSAALSHLLALPVGFTLGLLTSKKPDQDSENG